MKNSTLKFFLLVSLVLNITILSTTGYLYYKKNAYWTSPFGRTIQKDRFLFEELSLKPGQAGAMKDKAVPFRKEIDEKMREIAGKRRELIGLMRGDAPDVGAINSVISEIGKMQEEMQKKVTLHMLEEKALLEKDQQKKFLDLIENAMTEGRQTGCPSKERN